MDDNNIVAENLQELQARIVKDMERFAAQNPTIAEALAVMNLTMPEYMRAIEAIRGGEIVSASSVVSSALISA